MTEKHILPAQVVAAVSRGYHDGVRHPIIPDPDKRGELSWVVEDGFDRSRVLLVTLDSERATLLQTFYPDLVHLAAVTPVSFKLPVIDTRRPGNALSRSTISVYAWMVAMRRLFPLDLGSDVRGQIIGEVRTVRGLLNACPIVVTNDMRSGAIAFPGAEIAAQAYGQWVHLAGHSSEIPIFGGFAQDILDAHLADVVVQNISASNVLQDHATGRIILSGCARGIEGACLLEGIVPYGPQTADIENFEDYDVSSQPVPLNAKIEALMEKLWSFRKP